MKNLTWEQKREKLKEISDIVNKYNLKAIIDSPEHKSYIYFNKDDECDWFLKYPELDKPWITKIIEFDFSE